ncbi:MAG: tetratricopeptide repeat protein [Myxococcota bacterium]|nr:tetratricopeptide repeat protein [Myxococcota bacterium]
MGSADLTEGEEGADATLFGEEEADETLFGEDEEDVTSVLAEEDETSALAEGDETSALTEEDETSLAEEDETSALAEEDVPEAASPDGALGEEAEELSSTEEAAEEGTSEQETPEEVPPVGAAPLSAAEELECGLLLKLATLLEQGLGDLIGAFETYKELLEISRLYDGARTELLRLFQYEEHREEVATLLRPVFNASHDWESLHGLEQACLERLSDPLERSAAMRELATLSEVRLADGERAIYWLSQAFRELPDEEEVRLQLHQTAERFESHEALLQAYAAGREATQDLERRKDLGLYIAELYLGPVENHAAAEQEYQYILSFMPAEPAALRGLASLYQGQSRSVELAEVLQQLLSQSVDDEESCSLLKELAELYEGPLADPEQAIGWYQELLARSPEPDASLQQLTVLYAKVENWPLLFEVYEQQRELAEGEEAQLDLFKKMAELAGGALQQPAQAIDCWREALNIAPEDLEVLRALELLYEQEQSWRDLVDICERRLSLLQDDPAMEIELYSRLGEIWGAHLGRDERALECWLHVKQLSPANGRALAALRYLYRIGGDLTALEEINLQLLALPERGAEEQHSIYQELALNYEDEGRIEEAIQSWQALLQVSAGDLEALTHLETLYLQGEAWAEYAETLTLRVESSMDPDEQVELLLQLGSVYEEHLESPETALQTYQQVLIRTPENIEAFSELRRLYEEREEWPELVQLLQARSEVSDDFDERLTLYRETAVIYEERLDDPANALFVSGQAFNANPDDELFGDLFARLAAATDQWQALVSLYEGTIETLGAESPETVPLRMRVAGWYEAQLQQFDYAGNHYQYVLHIEPDHVGAMDALEALLERFENWGETVQMIERKLPHLYEPEARVEALSKLAKIRQQQLGLTDEAISAYQELLTLEPEHFEALEALEQLYLQREEWLSLIQILEQQNDLLEEGDERRLLNWLRIAELRNVRLSDRQGAIDAYQEAAALEDENGDALFALEELYRQGEHWYEVSEILQRLLLTRLKTDDQLKTYSRLALLQRHELQDPIGAIESYQRMLLLDPAYTEAVTALDEIYREQERWDELQEVYTKYLVHAAEAESQIRVRLALAELAQHFFEDTSSAVDYLTPILELDPAHRETLRLLAELFALEERWEDCIETLNRELELESIREERITRLYQIGRIFSQHLQQPEHAIQYFQQVLAEEPMHHEAMRALQEVYELQGSWSEAIQILQRMEASTRDFAEKSTSLYQMGRIYIQHLGDRPAGIEFYEQAISLNPENIDAAGPLAEHYLREERWERAEPNLELLLSHDTGEDPGRSKNLYFQLGFLKQQLLKDEEAMRYYQEAFRLDSTHLQTLSGMAEVAFRQEQWEQASNLLQTLQIHHGQSLEEEAKFDLLHRQGFSKLRLGDYRRALDVLTRAAELSPENETILGLIVEAYEAQERWEDAVFYRNRRAELLSDPEQRFDELITIAECYEEKLGDLRRTVEIYRRALELQPESKKLLNKLLPIYEAQAEWSEMATLLQHFAEREFNAEVKAKYYFAIGSLQRDQLQDNLLAVRSFDKALDADPKLLKAFTAIESLLVKERNFERQDRYFRKMLKRAKDNEMGSAMVFQLAQALGEINRTRLRNFGEAIKAYNIALAERPDDIGVHENIAELYEAEGNWDRAIGQYRQLLRRNMKHIESYHKLFNLFATQSRYDEAWCIAQALTVLNQATPEEREFFGQYQQRSLVEIRKPLRKQHWELLTHEGKSHLMDSLFNQLYPYNSRAMEQSFRDFRVHKRKDLIDQNEQTPLNKIMNYVSQTTGLPRLPCYKDNDGQLGVRTMNLSQPALKIGQDMLRGVGLQQLAFVLSRQLYLMTDHAFIATLDNDYESRRNRLMTVIFTFMKVLNIPVEMSERLLESYYERIPRFEQEKLRELLVEMQANQNKHLNISLWLQSLDFTACRLGFLLCNDLSAAIQTMRDEQIPLSRATLAERIEALVLFSISDEYFQLRRELGIALGGQ